MLILCIYRKFSLIGTDLLGSHIIVELSHQQRTGRYENIVATDLINYSIINCARRKKNLCGRVEVTDIPDYMNWQV